MLTSEQQAAVDDDSPRIGVVAGAGSGKTRVLTERVRRLRARGVSADRILCVTFTRAAAEEMRERLGDDGRGITIRTLHSWGYRLIQANPYRVGRARGLAVYDQADREDVMRLVASELGVKKTSARALERDPDVAREYEDTLQRSNAVDFNAIESLTLQLLRGNAAVRMLWTEQYEHVLVDEGQDVSLVQMAIVEGLAPRNLFVVGDERQCIPCDEVISTPQGDRAMGDLVAGDQVHVPNGRGVRVATVRHATNPTTKSVCRFELEDGTTVRASTDHPMFARLGPPQSWYVYLMYREGYGFRIGSTQTVGHSGSHILVRTQHECADALWILEAHDSSEKARQREHMLAYKNGIPMAPFKSRNGSMFRDPQEEADWWGAFDLAPGFALLDEYGLEFGAPAYVPKAGGRNVNLRVGGRGAEVTAGATGPVGQHPWTEGRRGGVRVRRTFSTYEDARDYAEHLAHDLGRHVVEYLTVDRVRFLRMPAAGVLPGFQVPVVRNGELVAMSVVRRVEEGESQCRDITVDHAASFVAGSARAVVHNCIYSWRGARPDILRGMLEADDWSIHWLTDNFRSARPIVETANRLMPDDPPSRAHRKGVDVATLAGDQVELACATATLLGASWGSTAILGRTWESLRQVRDRLEEFGVPCLYYGEDTDVWSSDEGLLVARLIRAMRNRFDDTMVRLIARSPAIRAVCAVDGSAPKVYDQAVSEGVRLLDVLADQDEAWRGIRDALLDEKLSCLEVLARVFGFLDLLPRLEAIGLTSRRDRLRELLTELAVSGWDAEQFCEWWADRSMQDRIRREADAVHLLTVHGSKGLEWDHVVVLDCIDGVYPGRNPEEDRRLLYVAQTRARDLLVRVVPPMTRWGEPARPSPWL